MKKEGARHPLYQESVTLQRGYTILQVNMYSFSSVSREIEEVVSTSNLTHLTDTKEIKFLSV